MDNKNNNNAANTETLYLIQNSFSTILLDAIQYFPYELREVKEETHGLLFGIQKDGFMECDYVFPVGNVIIRKKDEVISNPIVDKAIDNAKQIISTSKLIGSYHSHPNTSFFEEWAEPSNGDVDYMNQNKNSYELIIAISRNRRKERPLALQYQTKLACKYECDKNGDFHGLPKNTQLKNEFQYITGEFKKYKFEMRAYKQTEVGLCDINLYSSEAEMLMNLLSENIVIDKLTSEGVYRVRKLEYNFRLIHIMSGTKLKRIVQNIDYHIEQLRKETAK
jgi:proteasome lid subunit RPN8/RPN11